ncbi:hypothetical protein Syun_028248 [Stephania yunnanensis]|uniref:Uncharacterized protein n=1 Tax=Stephania yunnanensis TaxID=152371 RepID=A0AAP0EKE8_9MAGN
MRLRAMKLSRGRDGDVGIVVSTGDKGMVDAEMYSTTNDVETGLSYKGRLLNIPKSDFHSPITLEDGDIVTKRDEKGPFVTIFQRLQRLMDKQWRIL